MDTGTTNDFAERFTKASQSLAKELEGLSRDELILKLAEAVVSIKTHCDIIAVLTEMVQNMYHDQLEIIEAVNGIAGGLKSSIKIEQLPVVQFMGEA